MDMSGMDSGGTDSDGMDAIPTGTGPGLLEMQTVYWAFVAGAIAVAAASNVLFKALYWQR